MQDILNGFKQQILYTVNSRYNQVGYNEVPGYNEVVHWFGNSSI